MAYSSFTLAGFVVEFKPWSAFAEMLIKNTPTSMAKVLRNEGFDCVFGGIDLSIR